MNEPTRAKPTSAEDIVAAAIWDSLSGDTHTGVPLDDRTHQVDRFRKMARAAIKAMEEMK